MLLTKPLLYTAHLCLTYGEAFSLRKTLTEDVTPFYYRFAPSDKRRFAQCDLA